MSTPFRPEDLIQNARVLLTGALALARTAAQTLPEILEGAATGLLDGEEALRKATLAALEMARLRYPLKPPAPKAPEAPVELLLAADLGAGRADLELRVQALASQLKASFGERLRLSVPIREGQTRLFTDLRQLPLPSFFLRKLDAAQRAHHGLIALDETLLCASTPSRHAGLALAAAGLANADFKPTFALAGQVKALSASKAQWIRECLSHTQIFASGGAASLQLEHHRVDIQEGADPLWLETPAPAAPSQELLEGLGFDPHEPLITLVVGAEASKQALAAYGRLLTTLHEGLKPSLLVLALQPEARQAALELRALLPELPLQVATGDSHSGQALASLVAASAAVLSDEEAAHALASHAGRPFLSLDGPDGALMLHHQGPVALATALSPESAVQQHHRSRAMLQRAKAKAFYARLQTALLSRFPELARPLVASADQPDLGAPSDDLL